MTLFAFLLLTSFNEDLFTGCVEAKGVKACDLKLEHRYCFPILLAPEPSDLADLFDMRLFAVEDGAVVLQDHDDDFLMVARMNNGFQCTVAVGWYVDEQV